MGYRFNRGAPKERTESDTNLLASERERGSRVWEELENWGSMGRIEDRLKEFLSYKLIHILSSLLSQSYRRSEHANLHGLSPIRACKHLGPVWPVDARVGPPVPCADPQLRRVRFNIGGRRVDTFIPTLIKHGKKKSR